MTLPSLDPATQTDQIIAFIGKTFAEAGKATAVIALSGGIDSAVAFALTVKSLGNDHVLPLHLPSRLSNPQHTQDVQALLRTYAFPLDRLTTINIGSIIQKSWRIINRNSKLETRNSTENTPINSSEAEITNSKGKPNTGDEAGRFLRNRSDSSETQARTVESNDLSRPIAKSDRVKNDQRNPLYNVPSGTPDRRTHNREVARLNRLRLANLTARIRMMVLYDFAKQHDALVVGTENYSETLLGYFTRFGDEASDLEPIGHLYKTQVIQLAKHLSLPSSIIQKPPSADLWPGQTDQGEMGFSYEQADQILYLHDQGKTEAEIIAAGFDQNLLQSVLATVNTNKFKHLAPYRLTE